MCGIAGILLQHSDRPIDEGLLRRMAGTIAHRGPDAQGVWTDGRVGLAHRRLSIIDLADGDQPIANEDGTIRVVFNGEIYNFRELRRELKQKGHRFRTNSDTEVLVHLYEEYGEELVQRLRGMFAFALWDARTETLLLARDRVGLKPLYYLFDGEKLVFGSEIKAILCWPGVERTIDPQALEDYFAFGVVPGERSIFQSIRKLPPAHVLSLSTERPQPRISRYWQLRMAPDESLSENEWLERVRDKFDETVKVHRIADVPVGAFLSGGLDSSAIVASLAEAGGDPLRTFSIGFRERRFSELPHARQVAEKFGTRHTEEIVTPDAVSSLEDLVTYYDEPFADASAIPTMCVARVAREHVKVVLSGDGGDEAFGGYARYAHDLKEAALRQYLPAIVRRLLLHPAARMWPKADWLPRCLRLKTALTNLALGPAAAYANTLSIARLPLRRQLLHADLRNSLIGYQPETRVERLFGESDGDPLAGMLTADIGMLLPDDFLTKVDRASMAVGLEVRPPLVDHEFLELTAQLPSRLKIRNGTTKWLFKKLCDDWLPADIVHRPKQGFEIPVDDWLRGPLRDLFEASVLAPSAAVAELIDAGCARQLYEQHSRRIGRHGNTLWALLVLGCWSERYLTGDYSAPEQTPATAL